MAISTIHDLVTAPEIAKHLKMSRQRLHQLLYKLNIRPAHLVGRTRLYPLSLIDELRGRPKLKAGRPKKYIDTGTPQS